jgi:hypothetical protein
MCVQVQDSSQESQHFIVTVNKVMLTVWKQHHQMLMLAKNVYVSANVYVDKNVHVQKTFMVCECT